MRTLLVGLFSSVVLLSSNLGLAQENSLGQFRARTAPRTRAVSRAEPRMSFAKQQIYERAVYRARQRIARLQMRRSLRVTTGRPLGRVDYSLGEQYRYNMGQPAWSRRPLSRALGDRR